MIRRVLLLPLLLAGAAWAENHHPDPHPYGIDHEAMATMHDRPFAMVSLDRLEHGSGGDGESRLWELSAWYGRDYDRIRFESEGEGRAGESLEVVELQLVYDRVITPFWNLQAGLRHDVRPGGPDTSYAVLGLRGLAPQWLETDLGLFVSEDGDVSLRGEVEYDLLLTQRLVLQPHLEVDVNAGDVPELGLGSGLAATEVGLRLRYEIRRELAPYIGVRWERLHGGTRGFARGGDAPLSSTSFVVGIRAWW